MKNKRKTTKVSAKGKWYKEFTILLISDKLPAPCTACVEVFTSKKEGAKANNIPPIATHITN